MSRDTPTSYKDEFIRGGTRMPWTARDAYRHTKSANTPSLQNQWASAANSHLEKTGDEAAAIRIANAAVASRSSADKRRKPSTKPSKPPTKSTGPSKSSKPSSSAAQGTSTGMTKKPY
jgi:hypothetical protein